MQLLTVWQPISPYDNANSRLNSRREIYLESLSSIDRVTVADCSNRRNHLVERTIKVKMDPAKSPSKMKDGLPVLTDINPARKISHSSGAKPFPTRGNPVAWCLLETCD